MQPIKVSDENTSFALSRMAADCDPLQEYRELTVNAIQAIEKRCRANNEPIAGDVTWSIDEAYLEESGIRKLVCIDNGCGMSESDVNKYINHLFSSGSQQSLTSNFGVGARITAGARNPEGLEYQTWQNGKGIYARFFRDERGVYGLDDLEHGGRVGTTIPVDPSAKPRNIGKSGTMVVLHGRSADEHTTTAPDNSPMKSQTWLSDYLNRRFFRFPLGITVKVIEATKSGWLSKDWTHVRVKGMKDTLEGANGCATSKGTVPLEGATAHWWLIESNKSHNTRVEDKGHIAALFQDELYEFDRLSAGYKRLGSFGIFYGADRVVLYIEPDTQLSQITATTSRGNLRMNGQPLPWMKWAEEFRSKLPKKIVQMMDDMASAGGSRDNREAIQKRLQQTHAIIKNTKFRPAEGGRFHALEETAGGAVSHADDSKSSITTFGGKTKSKSAGPAGARFRQKVDPTGEPSEPASYKTQYPEVRWCTSQDGTRLPHEMEDRAAHYDPDTNVLKINRDFRVLQSVKKALVGEMNLSDATDMVDESVESWYEQSFTEAIYNVRTTLEGSPQWVTGSSSLDAAWSDEALTVIACQIFHVVTSARQELRTKLHKPGAVLRAVK